MGGHVVVTLDPGSRSVTEAEADLRNSLEDPPDIWTTDEYVCLRSFLDEQEQVREIDPPAEQLLTINYNNTVDCADGVFFEQLDGRWYLTDQYSEPEGSFGDQLLAYFSRGYGIEGVMLR